jgi:hypothetical protein
MEGGFSRDDFVVDHLSATVTCPAGHVAAISSSRRASFTAHCGGCSLRSRCTRAARGKVVHLTEHDDELVAARRQWREGTDTADYRSYRPMVERGMAWLTAKGNRRLRYRGVERNDAWLKTRVAALNLRRLVALGLSFDGTWSISSA